MEGHGILLLTPCIPRVTASPSPAAEMPFSLSCSTKDALKPESKDAARGKLLNLIFRRVYRGDVTALGVLICRCSTFMNISLPFMSTYSTEKQKLFLCLQGGKALRPFALFLALFLSLLLLFSLRKEAFCGNYPATSCPLPGRVLSLRGLRRGWVAPCPAQHMGKLRHKVTATSNPPLFSTCVWH